MTPSRRPIAPSTDRPRLRQTLPIRLDLLGNPYGPSVHVFDALASCDRLHLPAADAALALRDRIAATVGVAADAVVLANGVDELLDALFLWRRDRGPILLFPPSDPTEALRCRRHGVEPIPVQRAASFALALDPAAADDLPPDGTALVASPNDPTGTLLGSQETVRLSRACTLVVVDERHAAYSGRSLLPLAREFENIVVVQTFETWAGLAGLPLAYAVAPAKIARELAAYLPPNGVAIGSVAAAAATLDDLARVRASVHWVRQERSRLYRALRKLNLVQPLPSWANFLLVRVERGDRATVAAGLADRGILVAQPPHPELAPFLRVSAGRPEHTDALKHALIEIAAEI